MEREGNGMNNGQKPIDLEQALARHMPAFRVFASAYCRQSGEVESLVRETLAQAAMHFSHMPDDEEDLKIWVFRTMRRTFYGLEIIDLAGASVKPDEIDAPSQWP
jgi:DNA-directed RNA polymerase specialized sigma24 family protein